MFGFGNGLPLRSITVAGRAVVLCGLLALLACGTPGTGDTEAVFYPPLPQLPRVQYLTTINAEEDIGGGGGSFVNFLTGVPSKVRALTTPWDIAHAKGKIYVIDRGFRNVVVIDLVEKSFEQIEDQSGGPMKQPMGIFVDDQGYQFIADRNRRQILVFGPNGKFSRAYGMTGQASTPTDVAVYGDRIYAVDVRENEIEVIDRGSGEGITRIGGTGPEQGSLYRPTFVTVNENGEIFVTDFLNFRVQKFGRDLKPSATFGGNGRRPGDTPRPKGIAVDREGHLYVVDAAFEIIQIFDAKTGQILLGFGKFGRGGMGASWLPGGIDIDYDNVEHFARYAHPDFRLKYLVYVTNQVGPRKLNVYGFGEWTGPLPQGARRPEKKPNTGSVQPGRPASQ